MRMLDSFGSFHFGRLAFGTSIHNLARILESLTSTCTRLAHKKCMFWTVMRAALGESTHTCERFLSYRVVVATLCHIMLRKCRPLVASRLEPTQDLISHPLYIYFKFINIKAIDLKNSIIALEALKALPSISTSKKGPIRHTPHPVHFILLIF